MTSERKVKVKGKFVLVHVTHTRGSGGVAHLTRNIEASNFRSDRFLPWKEQ